MARVLVIDDNPDIRALLREAFELHGYEVEVAANGRAALRLVRERPVDVVITDIFMPEQDGIETILELRRDFPDVKIIAMSGGGTTGNLSYLPAATQLGAVHSISKPFDCLEVVATVREMLDR
ncbi:MAG: response regulator [Candidatus Rokubacteria bacterium]|nr:response regulator [Candidatus Rokubacteria bacterium]